MCWLLLSQIWWLLQESFCWKKKSPLWEVIHLLELKSGMFYTPGRCFLSIAVKESQRFSRTELKKNGKDDLASHSCSGYDLLWLMLKSCSAKVFLADSYPWRGQCRLNHQEKGTENCVLHFQIYVYHQVRIQTSLECEWESFSTIADQCFVLTWLLEVF